ncbi:MAG: hypothetical protein JSR44_12645 [Spirochaetes bacterium]|nr:hypothetical protein [Spirochaetota bacterium]
MEYIAFLFLGLGLFLVLAGVLLQYNERRANGGVSRTATIDDYLQKMRDLPKSDPKPALATAGAAFVRPHSDTLGGFTPVMPQTPSAALSAVAQPVPGAFQFVQQEPAVPQAPAREPVAVSVQQKNPRLFEKFAYLYLDSSAKNVYDGAGSAVAFDLSEVSGIRRFGRGVFSYDGFSFYFDHNGGQERFPLQFLKTVGFYPNCVALTQNTSVGGVRPVALLFMEETESIRKVLETFRAPHGN